FQVDELGSFQFLDFRASGDPSVVGVPEGGLGRAVRMQVAATGPAGVSSCTMSPADFPAQAASARCVTAVLGCSPALLPPPPPVPRPVPEAGPEPVPLPVALPLPESVTEPVVLPPVLPFPLAVPVPLSLPTPAPTPLAVLLPTVPVLAAVFKPVLLRPANNPKKPLSSARNCSDC